MKKILIGIGGGIAAYKTATVVSRLRQDGHDVQVAMTPAATRFVTPLTFAALSQKEVRTELFPERTGSDRAQIYPHLYPATEADLLLILPATADLIAKLALGLGDDIVSASALSVNDACRCLFCPAMNPQMWVHPAVQQNIRTLESRGWVRIGPETGAVACGSDGTGRMAEPDAVLEALIPLLA